MARTSYLLFLAFSLSAWSSWSRTVKPCYKATDTPERLPAHLDRLANPDGIKVSCRRGVTWQKSKFVLELLAKNNANPDDFKFKVCVRDDLPKDGPRKFPIMYTTNTDWRYRFAAEGRVILSTEKMLVVWNEGFQQVIGDALEYFARQGHIAGYPILPKFILYGFSKGATQIMKLNRWRPDIIQGAVVIHGCSTPRVYDDTFDKRASNPDGMAPAAFWSSMNDTFYNCTHGDTERTVREFRRSVSFSSNHIFWYQDPCGHHPEQCSGERCNVAKSYVNPLFQFVTMAEAYQFCTFHRAKRACEDSLCIWSPGTETCRQAYPTGPTPACAAFCRKLEVGSCDRVDSQSACEGSYVLVEDGVTTGLQQHCAWTGAACASDRNEQPVQCLFQEDACGLKATTPLPASTLARRAGSFRVSQLRIDEGTLSEFHAA